MSRPSICGTQSYAQWAERRFCEIDQLKFEHIRLRRRARQAAAADQPEKAIELWAEVDRVEYALEDAIRAERKARKAIRLLERKRISVKRFRRIMSRRPRCDQVLS